MRVAGLDSSGDWRFGKGRAVYVRDSEAIRQNVTTRLRSFANDWFADMSVGVDWIALLGSRNNETRILREIERVVLNTEGVRTIDRLRLVGIDKRAAKIELRFTDIFNRSTDQTVSTP